MWIRKLETLLEFTAGDESSLQEILHPGKDELAIRYSLARAVVHPGKRTLPHSLEASEVYYVLQGSGIMHIDGESAALEPGQTVYIPPRRVQHIENAGREDLIFLCIVDPAWKPEDEKVY